MPERSDDATRALEVRLADLLSERDPRRRDDILGELTATWRVSEVVSSLYRLCQDNPFHALELLRGTQALGVGREAVRTIAVSYFRVGVGGAERVVLNLTRMWLAEGKRVVLLTDEGESGSVATGDGPWEIPEGVKWVELPPQRDRNAETYLPRAQALEAALEENHVDALVINQWIDKLLPWDLLVAKLLGIETTIHTHGPFTIIAGSQFDGHKPLPVAYSLADGVVCLGELDHQFWRIAAGDRVYRTVNLPRYSCADEQVSPLDSKEVLWVGRLADDKRPDRALSMFALVLKTCADARLTIVGGGTPDHVAALRRQADELGISDAVSFEGEVDDPGPYYRRASVYLLTSPAEGYPFSLAESKVFGLPCVMYDVPTLQFLLDPHGIVAVPQDDEEAMAQEVCAILADDALRRRMGRDARAQAEELEKFDLGGLWARILDAGLSERTHDEPLRLRMWDVFWENEFLRDRREYATHWQEHLRTEEASKALKDSQDALEASRDALGHVERSVSFRVGRTLTAPLRGIRDSLGSRQG